MLLLALLVSCSAGCVVDAGEEEEGDDEFTAEISEELVTSGVGFTNTTANLRAAPSTSSAIKATLPSGTKVTVTGPAKNAGGRTWVPVKTSAGTGWIAASLLSPAPPLDLVKVKAYLGSEAKRRTPGSKVSITLEVLNGTAKISLNGDAPRPSASSAKAVWAAAALAKNDAASLEDEALPTFISSNNDTAGELIGLAGGADAVNEFYTKAGMKNSGLLKWNQHVDGDEPAPIGAGRNYMTSNDAVTFLRRVDKEDLLPPAKRTTLLRWMKLAPDTGDAGGWLPARLPADVRAKVMHKAGWLPPPLESRATNEIGIVPTASGRRYAVAILTTLGADWNAQTDFVEFASCILYRAVERAESMSCERR